MAPPRRAPERQAARADFAALYSRMLAEMAPAVRSAMAEFLDVARRAMLDREPPDVQAAGPPPDPSYFPGQALWRAIVERWLTPVISGFWGESFAETALEANISDTPFREAYLEEVWNRLAHWPDEVFEEIRIEIEESIDLGESIDEQRDRIGEVLNIDAMSRDIQDEIAEFEAELRQLGRPDSDVPERASIEAEIRAEIAQLHQRAEVEDRRWHPAAERIARTETIGALNGGSHAGAMAWTRETGERQWKEWLATEDERTRHSHVVADGQVVELDENFEVGRAGLRFPGDPAGPPGEVINCRCRPLYLDITEAPERMAAYERKLTEMQGDNITAGARRRAGPLVAELDTPAGTLRVYDTVALGRVAVTASVPVAPAAQDEDEEVLESDPGSAEEESAVVASVAGNGLAYDPKAPAVWVAASETETATPRYDAPLYPPAEWFADPQLPEYAPSVTVTNEGRVMIRAALWKTCHTGIDGVCVTPPHSPSDYSKFHLGQVQTADGSLVAAGTVAIETRHADAYADPNLVSAHYADTGAAVARVRAGEDEYGIWLAGSLVPGVTAEQVAALLASPISGDWRDFGGGLELVAALGVNYPGFPGHSPDERATVRVLSASAAPGTGAHLVLATRVEQRPAPDALELRVIDARLREYR